MKIETTSVVGLMTGKIKNNPSIYASKNGFNMFLNGELIMTRFSLEPKSEMYHLRNAKNILEDLKDGTYKRKDIQERFDSFIKE